MSTNRVSDDEIMTTLRDVVAKRPDHVYEPLNGETCVYVADGAPSCLVGHVLVPLGASLLHLAEADTGMVPANGVRDVARLAGLDISETAGEALDAAQMAQDTGHLWSEALSRAEEVFNG